jgi:hypothetical protein
LPNTSANCAIAGRRAGGARAGARRRHDDQGNVRAAGERLRRGDRLEESQAHEGHRLDGARSPSLLRRLVLGLAGLGRGAHESQHLETRLAGGREERAAQHGLRPVLHQLPRLGEGTYLRLAAQHRGRARRAAGVSQPRFLSRTRVRPARGGSDRRRGAAPRGKKRRRPVRRHLRQRGEHGRRGPAAREARPAVGNLRQRLDAGGRTEAGEPIPDLGPVHRLP